ncbi:DUF58 domain-containing protein [Frateuria defendens]|uniref:DUF58 domain-containing protein n=1 Tax=Frateuria defendens TaxID=2219559 RepID=UPI00066FE079|nr:DUF58 domain-containing protein [Frateuria defendens]
MREALLRLQQSAERRLPALTRYRRPEPLPIALHRRRIYIVPTGFGLGFGGLLLVMMTGALNYSNNAALLLTCLLAAAAAASMLAAFRALDGLRLQAVRAGHAVAGEPLALTLEFVSVRPRSALRVDLGDSMQAFALDSGHAAIALPLATEHRGWQALPRLRVWSSWPLGMFRAWSWLHPQQQVLVWPRAEASGPPPRQPADESSRVQLRHGDELAALRDYRRGDAMRRIAWKSSARHHGLLVKEFEQPEPRPAWHLDWRAVRGLDDESRIARLARWLGEAQQQGRPYSLWLPGEEIGLGSGAAHYAHCMDALAKLP